MIKREKDIIDATPSKRLYRSIIADYGLTTAISELVDNVIDSRTRRKFTRTVEIRIDADYDDQTITISDDGGGIKEIDLSKLVSPGSSHSNGKSASIGIFGVGSKRAAVALARDIKIATRYGNEPHSYQVEYDDDWLQTEDWHLPYYQIDSLKKNTTRILLSRLRFIIMEEDCANLRKHLGYTYANFIKDKEVKIFLNEEEIAPRFFDQWAYPHEAKPKAFNKRLTPHGHTLPILFNITSGLTYEPGSIGGNYGVFVYCNRRLILAASRAPEFGFQSGVAGVPHPRMSNARVIIELTGGASHLPWNSNKTGINFNHEVFKALREDIHTAVKNATALSKRLQTDYYTAIEPHKTGTVKSEKLRPDERLKPSKLPPIPRAIRSPLNAIKESNKSVAEAKPWTVPAYEGIIAVETIKKQKTLSQKNRLVLIILDSTMEIAFKDYLAHDINQPMSESKLSGLFNNRIDVHKEVSKTIATSDLNLWKRLDYFFKMRCELIHKRASVNVSDEDIAKFQDSCEKLLNKMYSLQFPNLK